MFQPYCFLWNKTDVKGEHLSKVALAGGLEQKSPLFGLDMLQRRGLYGAYSLQRHASFAAF